jgi:antitoxin (DNA-binding transcriptional repressor) of toxin-antitoxin stability system
MRAMSIREFRDSLSMLDQIVEKEQEILVTRHGRALARVTPVNPCRTAPSHADLRASMPPQSVPSEVLIREDRERG